jgi:hypothetical protein
MSEKGLGRQGILPEEIVNSTLTTSYFPCVMERTLFPETRGTSLLFREPLEDFRIIVIITFLITSTITRNPTKSRRIPRIQNAPGAITKDPLWWMATSWSEIQNIPVRMILA